MINLVIKFKYDGNPKKYERRGKLKNVGGNTWSLQVENAKHDAAVGALVLDNRASDIKPGKDTPPEPAA